MKIRRYMAKNTQEAILKVKMDLGNDALILNTRKVRQKGFFGLFAKPLVEVLAAIDEYGGRREPENVRYAPGAVSAVREAGNKINPDEKEEKISNLENKINSMEQTLQRVFLQTQADKASGKPVQMEKPPSRVAIPEIFYSNLVKNEVEADIAKKIMDAVASKIGENSDVNDTAAVYHSIISGLLGKPETIRMNPPGKPTVVIFVGPTGVGKTTTLAKIAANYLLIQKKTVGMITADTYRIAAVEQLKTYAEILGIPVNVAYSPGDIVDAVGQHSDKDLILIDTAGRSHRNKTQFEELKALVAASGADEIYLVLSATISPRSCREIVSSYDFLKDYKLIFTKTDEAPAMGIVLNVRYLTGKKLSYITTGQSVPDDIETVNIDKISKKLMGSINS